jgi:hypothetical protein
MNATITTVILGTGLFTTLVQIFLNYRLSRHIETQKSEFQRQLALLQSDLQRELEGQKAFLLRASKIHERQIDVLCDLYAGLFDTSEYFKHANRKGFRSFESPEQYRQEFAKSFVATVRLFNQRRLLLPSALASQIDTFFKKASEGDFSLSFALDPQMPSGDSRAKNFDAAAQMAFHEIPPLLADIEHECRQILGIE